MKICFPYGRGQSHPGAAEPLQSELHSHMFQLGLWRQLSLSWGNPWAATQHIEDKEEWS